MLFPPRWTLWTYCVLLFDMHPLDGAEIIFTHLGALSISCISVVSTPRVTPNQPCVAAIPLCLLYIYLLCVLASGVDPDPDSMGIRI
jgi:hypothetical protein